VEIGLSLFNTINISMIKSAGALFFCISTRRYLFLLRDNHRHSNTWCFPGGKIRKNESEFDGTLREINEELGLTIPYIKVIPIEKFTSEDKQFEYHTFVFLIKNEFIPILNKEHRGYCWTSIDGWPKPLHPALFNTLNENIIKEKLNFIEENF